MEPGGLWRSNVLNWALPPQSLSPDTWLEHPDPVSHMTQKKREKKEKKERKERKKERKKKERRKEGRKKERTK